MSRPWLATGVVEAPVDAVFAALLASGPAAGTQHNPPWRRYGPRRRPGPAVPGTGR